MVYKQNNYLGYTNSPSLANAVVRGYCLVVQSAYPSNPLTGKNITETARSQTRPFMAQTRYRQPCTCFNPTNKQYEAYMQKQNTPITTADTTANLDPGIAIGSATNMIASGQGFFVRAGAPIQTLSFRETAKTTAQPSATKLNLTMGKPVATNTVAEEPLIRLQMLADTINTDEIVVLLNNKASTAYSDREDASDMGGISPEVSLSALSSDSVKLCISRLPFPKKTSQIVPLYVDAYASGPYQLKLTQLANLAPIYEVWLKDGLSNDSVNMPSGYSLQFYNQPGQPGHLWMQPFPIGY